VPGAQEEIGAGLALYLKARVSEKGKLEPTLHRFVRRCRKLGYRASCAYGSRVLLVHVHVGSFVDQCIPFVPLSDDGRIFVGLLEVTNRLRYLALRKACSKPAVGGIVCIVPGDLYFCYPVSRVHAQCCRFRFWQVPAEPAVRVMTLLRARIFER